MADKNAIPRATDAEVLEAVHKGFQGRDIITAGLSGQASLMAVFITSLHGVIDDLRENRADTEAVPVDLDEVLARVHDAFLALEEQVRLITEATTDLADRVDAEVARRNGPVGGMYI